MKSKDSFMSDEHIIKLHDRARRMVANDANFDIEDFINPNVSSFKLFRMVEVYRKRARALTVLKNAASMREYMEYAHWKAENKRIEELIWKTSESVSLGYLERYELPDESGRVSVIQSVDDGKDTIEFILSRLVDYSCLTDLLDSQVIAAFSKKEIYFEIYEDRKNRTPQDWAALVEKYAGMAGVSVSAAGAGHI